MQIPIGAVGHTVTKIEKKHTIDFMGPEVPQVLASLWLFWYMEHACRNAILPFMEANEDNVGVGLQASHLAATPMGAILFCEAKVVEVKGKEIVFEVIANDGVECVSQGTHKRRIVDKTRFATKINEKTAKFLGANSNVW